MQTWNFLFTRKAVSDLKQILKNGTIRERVKVILEDIAKDPRSGIGKPERLKYMKTESWSRRIDSKNRVEYIIDQNTVTIVSILGHYDR